MTIATLFLIEATAVCGPAAPARLGGGAQVVRAVLDFEEEAADSPAVTLASVSQPTGAAPGDAKLETNDPDSDPAPARCKMVSLPIA